MTAAAAPLDPNKRATMLERAVKAALAGLIQEAALRARPRPNVTGVNNSGS
jgi:hypothetical protein